MKSGRLKGKSTINYYTVPKYKMEADSQMPLKSGGGCPLTRECTGRRRDIISFRLHPELPQSPWIGLLGEK